MDADIFAELNQAIAAAPPEPPPPAPITTVIAAPGAKDGNVVGPVSFPEIPADFGRDDVPAAMSVPVSADAPKNIDRSDRLEKLVDDALAKTQELLEIPLIPGDDDFVKIASMQKDLVVSIINTGVKVDENRFKKRQGDALTGILQQLVEREKNLKPLLDLTPTALPN